MIENHPSIARAAALISHASRKYNLFYHGASPWVNHN